MNYQKEFVMLKPGVRERHIVGALVQRFENKGLELLALKLFVPTETQLKKLYKEHVGKAFFDSLVKYMLSGPVVAMVWGGTNAVAVCRGLVGATDPLNALPGSIRGDYAINMPDNVVHASDSEKSATWEMTIFFKSSDMLK